MGRATRLASIRPDARRIWGGKSDRLLAFPTRLIDHPPMRLPIPELKVLLYGPGVPNAGVRARARFQDGVFVVEGDGHWFAIQADHLYLRTGGYDGRQWLVRWKTPDGTVTAMLQGDDAVDALIRLAPAGNAAQLARARRAVSDRWHRPRLVLMTIILAILVPLLGLIAYQANVDHIGRWAAARVTPENEARIGARVFERIRPGPLLIESGPASDAMARVGIRLTVGLRHHYRFHLVDDPAIDAYALPGGDVIIHAGTLLAARNIDELAGVLAHQVAHVESGHALRALLRALGWRANLAVVMEDYDNPVWKEIAEEVARGARIPDYDREMEREADAQALSILRHAGIPGVGLADFIERLARPGSAAARLSARHPADLERLTILREQIERQGSYPRQPLPIDWQRVHADLSKRSPDMASGPARDQS